MSAFSIRALEAGVRNALRGFEVVDRDLVVGAGDGDARVDLVGHDPHGRLVLVVHAETVDDATLLRTLHAAAFAHAACREAVRPWLAGRLDPTRAPLVWLVVEDLPAPMLGPLALLAESGVAVHLLHRRGEAVDLEHRDVGPSPRAHARQPADVMGAWPDVVRERASDLARRIGRVDPALLLRAGHGELRWEWHERVLATLTCREGVLEFVDPDGAPPVAVTSPASADAWLEGFVRSHAARLASENQAPRPLDLLGRGGGPLLTPEEIAAFRD